MGFQQRWEQEDYVDTDDFAPALTATLSALSLSAVVLRDDLAVDDDDCDDEEHGSASSSVTIESTSGSDLEEIVRLKIAYPIIIGGEFEFSGGNFTFDADRVAEPWELAYLFMAHAATAVGAVPEPLDDFEESRFIEDAREWIEACVSDELTDAGTEMTQLSISIDAKPGAIGPFQLHGSRVGDKLVVMLGGAATDLRVTVSEDVSALTPARIDALMDAARERLVECVADERAFILGRSMPVSRPEHGGQLVLHAWVDGVCLRTEVLAPAQSLQPAVARARAEGTCDIVWYLTDGTPLGRWVPSDVDDDLETMEDFWSHLTWHWMPASTAHLAAAFAAAARCVPKVDLGPALPPTFAEEKTLRSWFRDFRRISKKLSDVSLRELLESGTENDLLPNEWTGSTIDDTSVLFFKLYELLAGGHLDHEQDASWLNSGPLYDDGAELFLEELAETLGLPAVPDLRAAYAAPQPQHVAVLAAYNQAAERRGLHERLYAIPFDEFLVIKLTPSVYAALVTAGVLRPDPASPG